MRRPCVYHQHLVQFRTSCALIPLSKHASIWHLPRVAKQLRCSRVHSQADGWDNYHDSIKTRNQTKESLKADAESRMKQIVDKVEAAAASAHSRVGDNGVDVKDLRGRIKTALQFLNEGLVERDTEVRLLLLAVLSGEHMLYIGPPGTAKSEMSRRLAAVLKESSYFERLLTRFSVPEELFGPLSMRALEMDTYLRKTRGYLPEAQIAFIDEVFKANSAILNTLLTILNERLFDNGSQRVEVPLLCLVAASNELPESEELDALYDRFLVRKQVQQVSAGGLSSLLSYSSSTEARQDVTSTLSMEDVQHVRSAAVKAVKVPQHVVNLIVDLRTFMQEKLEPPAYVSDRRLVKALAMLQVAAYTNGRTTVSEYDALLLQHVMWSRPEDAERIYDWLLSNLSVDSDMKQSNYLLSSLFGRTCHALQDEAKLAQISDEMRVLREVLVEKLEQCVTALEGGFPLVRDHLWLAREDADAISAALLPKLQKTLEAIQTTLFELVTLELAVERRVDAVVLANLMPRFWAEFIRSSSDVEARSLGTLPRKY